MTKDQIQAAAVMLHHKYKDEYKQWVKETGGIMHGATMKADVMKKASFCESEEELLAMRTCYDVCLRSAEGPNGWRFSRDAMDVLIELLHEEIRQNG